MTVFWTQSSRRMTVAIPLFLATRPLKSSQSRSGPPLSRMKLTMMSFASYQVQSKERRYYSKPLRRMPMTTSRWNLEKSLSLRTCPEPEESLRRSDSRRRLPSEPSIPKTFLSCNGPTECTSRPRERFGKLFVRLAPPSRLTGRAPLHPTRMPTEILAAQL